MKKKPSIPPALSFLVPKTVYSSDAKCSSNDSPRFFIELRIIGEINGKQFSQKMTSKCLSWTSTETRLSDWLKRAKEKKNATQYSLTFTIDSVTYNLKSSEKLEDSVTYSLNSSSIETLQEKFENEVLPSLGFSKNSSVNSFQPPRRSTTL